MSSSWHCTAPDAACSREHGKRSLEVKSTEKTTRTEPRRAAYRFPPSNSPIRSNLVLVDAARDEDGGGTGWGLECVGGCETDLLDLGEGEL
jgi:hypothetical protein